VGQRAATAVIAIVALGVVASAVVWVSAVRFKDEASAWDCGVPLGAALHGYKALAIDNVPRDASGHGLIATPEGTSPFVTVCRGEARTRVAIAGVAIVVAVASVIVVRRRWGRSSPPAVSA